MPKVSHYNSCMNLYMEWRKKLQFFSPSPRTLELEVTQRSNSAVGLGQAMQSFLIEVTPCYKVWWWLASCILCPLTQRALKSQSQSRSIRGHWAPPLRAEEQCLSEICTRPGGKTLGGRVTGSPLPVFLPSGVSWLAMRGMKTMLDWMGLPSDPLFASRFCRKFTKP